MKRFNWSLQRYLDVVRQRESALRAEVLAAARKASAVRRKIKRRRQALDEALRGLSAEPVESRLPRQQVAADCFGAERQAMRAMEAELADIEALHKELLARLKDVRARRETLEKLRAEALDEHLRRAAAAEQKHHDEISQIAFVRNSAGPHADCRSMTA